jgi:hypothetical protein
MTIEGRALPAILYFPATNFFGSSFGQGLNLPASIWPGY